MRNCGVYIVHTSNWLLTSPPVCAYSLSKYRGTYLDMDVIVLRSFDDSLTNFAGAESSEDVAAGIISFDDTYFGRQISELCLR